MRTAMTMHLDSDEVQQQGCRGLLNLSTGGAICERAVLEAGGAKMAVAAMHTHPADVGVTWLGCRLLANIASMPRLGKREVRLASGAVAVCAVLQAHPDLPHQLEGCRALGFIVTGDAEDQASLHTCGAPRLAIRALQAFPREDELASVACQVLVGLSQGDAKCKQSVIAAAAEVLGTGNGSKLVQRLSYADRGDIRLALGAQISGSL